MFVNRQKEGRKRIATRGKGVAVGFVGLCICSLLDEERGEVPGWVLIVLMTSALVVAIWTVAGGPVAGGALKP